MAPMFRMNSKWLSPAVRMSSPFDQLLAMPLDLSFIRKKKPTPLTFGSSVVTSKITSNGSHCRWKISVEWLTDEKGPSSWIVGGGSVTTSVAVGCTGTTKGVLVTGMAEGTGTRVAGTAGAAAQA